MTRKESYQKAFEEKALSLAAKKARYQRVLDDLMQNNPRLAAIESRISLLGAQIAITAISGDAESLLSLRAELESLSREKSHILEMAGLREIEYDCPVCLDTGYVGGKICQCIKESAKANMIKALSENLPFENSRFEDFDLKYYTDAEIDGTSPKKRMTQLLKLCKEYTLHFDPVTADNLLFMGNAGLGKTHLSLAIVQEVLKQGFDVVYASAYNLFSQIESEHFGKHTNEKYESVINCDLLVIDDLGGEFVSPYIQSVFYNITNTRLLSGKPTIINTNLSMLEIEERYTPRVSSRLVGGYKAKRFLGSDIRQIKKFNNGNLNN